MILKSFSSTHRLLSLLGLSALLLAACVSDAPPRPAETVTGELPQSAAEPREAHGSKVSAPVQVDLSYTILPAFGQLQVTLAISATSDVPRAVARVVLPPGATLVSGKLEEDLGPLAAGEQRTLFVAIEAPPSGTLAAGVDCHMTSTVKLHRAASLELGPKAKDPTEVIDGGDKGEGVRMQRLQ